MNTIQQLFNATCSRITCYASVFSLIFLPLNGYQITHQTTPVNTTQQKIAVTITLDPQELLYANTFKVSANNPKVTLSTPQATEESSTQFDEQTQVNQHIFQDAATYIFTAQLADDTARDTPQTTQLIASFETKDTSKLHQEIISIDWPTTIGTAATVEQTTHAKQPVSCPVPQPSLLAGFSQKITNFVKNWSTSVQHQLQSLFKTTGSRWLRFLLVLLIGILLSLTPCIYPMIPITIGILQTNQTKSAIRGFLLALAYTLGISTTFAAFGLFAVLTSCVMGELQGSVWMVAPIAFMLFYFGFSMLGAYELYIPSFFRPQARNVKGGSLLSAYIFGAISGTVASPCLSSGLIFVLNYVSALSAVGTLAGYIESLLLLFVFGIGSSLPLLIIGTFSTSLNVLPKAGMWMVEVNKIFGIMLVSMGFYQLSNIHTVIPWSLTLIGITLFFAGTGLYYFVSITSSDSSFTRIYKTVVGILLLLAASLSGTKVIKAVIAPTADVSSEQLSYWITNHTQALEKAKKENKKLFIDVGATYCAACKELDAEIFALPVIKDILTTQFVPLKVEADENKEAYSFIKEHFISHVKGYPTYLVVNPTTLEVTHQWSVELEEHGIEKVAELFKQAA